MEKISFNKICSKIPDKMLNKIANDTIKSNREKFNELFKENVQKIFPGFRNVKNVPVALLSKKIVQKCLENPLIAKVLLEQWLQIKQPLAKQVKEKLEELSYECKQPDFESEFISFEYLKDEHTISIDSLSYSNIFNEIDDKENLFEVTLISVLFGWFPSYYDDNNSNDMPQDSNSSNSQFFFTAQDDFIKELNHQYDSFEKSKQKINEFISSIENYIKDEKQISFNDNYLSLFNNYNEAHSNFLKIAKNLYNLIEDSLSIKSIELPKPPLIEFESESLISIKQKLLSFYENFLELVKELIQEKLSMNKSLLQKIDEDDRCAFEKKLEEIQQKFLSNYNLDGVKEIIYNLEEIENDLKTDIDSYNFLVALNDLETKTSKRAERFIIDLFKSNQATFIDELIFFMFLFPNKILLSTELKKYLIQVFITFLGDLNREKLLAVILNETIHDFIVEIDEGKKLLIIIAIILYTFNEEELATSIIFKEDIYNVALEFDTIRQIVEVISKGQALKFYTSKKNELKKSEELLIGYFSKDKNYQDITSGIEKKYKTVLENDILPELKKFFEQIRALKDFSQIHNLLNKISDPKYPSDLYLRFKKDLPKNYTIEKKIEKIIEDIIEKIISYKKNIEYEFEFSKMECIPSNNLASDLDKFFEKCVILNPIKKTVSDILIDYINQPEKTKTNPNIDIENYIASLILESKFYSKHCPEVIKTLNEKNASLNQIYEIIKHNFNINNELNITIEKLKSFKCYKSLELFRDSIEKNDLQIIEDFKKKDLQFLEELENFLKNNNKILPQTYFYIKEQERYIYCKNILMQEKNIVLEEKKKSSEMLFVQFNNLQKLSAKTRFELIDEKEKFSEHTFNQILDALKIIDEISQQKKENKLELAQSLLKEIEHLRQFNNESLDLLNKLLRQYYEDDSRTSFEDSTYIKLPLKDIKLYLTEDDYLSLGLTKQQWMEISSDRKEYIIDLIDSWLFLMDKPSTKEDIQKAKLKLEEIEEKFIELVKNLCSICSLYKTNDSKKIGQEPTHEWNYSTDLPFLFTTRLQSPRCSSLDKLINFFVITQTQTSSKKYINRIKDFISDKYYDQTAFNVIILLDNKERFEKINTSSFTKNLPVLDEFALKRIIFSVAENRLPKWQFVSLLTLNRKISTIQPFKTQGSVDNNNGIFVGRTEIIKEITSSRKDFAIYGGRKIGKSSLLAVISDILLKNGYVISIQSFQGIDNSLTVAKSIIEDLKMGGLKASSLIPINSLDDFSFNLLSIYRENAHKNVAIILDEMDELIHKERKLGRHQIIEIFRNVSHTTNHQWRFIFAGFKEMYLEIHGKGIYENWKNPWQNFVDDSNKQLTEIESPTELIDEGLKYILGLEYDKEIISLITEYSTGHPAFLQKFCECLVKSIDNRISLENRRIYAKDVKDVFEKDNEFINFVKETLDLNLSTMQELITVIAAMNDKEVFNISWLLKELETYVELFNKKIRIDPKKLDLDLELLTITGIIKRTTNKDEFRFTHPYYIKILKRLEIIDKNLIEDLINKIYELDEN